MYGTIFLKGVIVLATKKQNITLNPDVFDEFCKYAGKKGIKISTWINIKIMEFIEEELAAEAAKKKRS
jgi:hypothetical protein